MRINKILRINKRKKKMEFANKEYLLLLLLLKRRKAKRGPKGEKPRREKKGKQPETADAPADELDTPISETDMQ